jgi:hypothetical protein
MLNQRFTVIRQAMGAPKKGDGAAVAKDND